MFKNRTDAGRKLAIALKVYRGENGIAVALPRGGVVLGYEVAKALSMPLDVVIVRKIAHPSAPEYAIGVIDETSMGIWNNTEVARVDPVWLHEEIARQQEEAVRRIHLYRPSMEPVPVKGMVVIIVDDGMATGLTMRLPVRSLRAQGAEKIIVAVPVASSSAVHMLKEEGVDEIFVLEPPSSFSGAVGAYYEEFPQVTDEEVIDLLAAHAAEFEVARAGEETKVPEKFIFEADTPSRLPGKTRGSEHESYHRYHKK